VSDNTVQTGADTIRTIDRTTAKTQVVGLDMGGETGPESLVAVGNGLPTLDQNMPDVLQLLKELVAIGRANNLLLCHMVGITILPGDMLGDESSI
jgi:hypothetical protein